MASITLDDEEAVTPGLDESGKPDPAYARSLGLIAAPLPLRSLAFALDAAIVLLLTLPLSLGALPLWLSVFVVNTPRSLQSLTSNDEFMTGLLFYVIGHSLLSVFLLIQLILHGVRGVTIGKAIVGIRSVKATTFAKPGFWRVVFRALVFWTALGIIPIVGAIPFLLSPLWDSERRGRGWLDRIGGNWLIDVRRGLDPFDPKALRHARKMLTVVEGAPVVELPSLATGAEGVVPSFVPASRSRSGVVSAPSFGADSAEAWQPPPVGAPLAPPPSTSSAPPAPPQAPSALPPSSAPAMAANPGFLFDDGRWVAITGQGLVGRSPAGREGEQFEQLIPLVDESMQISKTHAAFGIDADGVWIIDRGSSNGTRVVPLSGEPFSVVPWEQTRIGWNSIVELGGRSFTVAEAPARNGRSS